MTDASTSPGGREGLTVLQWLFVGVIAATCLAAGTLIGWWLAPKNGPAAAAVEEVWTCSMHPQIRRPGRGKCPICHMDLVPVSQTGGLGPREFATSEQALALMDIQTAPVRRAFATADIRMVGKIAYDETRLAGITAWVPGRLERLFVDYTGVPVRKGDHMVEIYSPDLLAAQEELIQAAAAVKALGASDVGIVRQTTEATLVASREKLTLLGLTPEQVRRVETSGKAQDRVTIYAPASGIVTHINEHARTGMQVDTGTRIYTIADLSTVWVTLEAYESDLAWLKYGQGVRFVAEAYPGRTFTGKIAFIDPVLNDRTRTVRVRVNAPNAAGLLKPNMFVRATVTAQVAAGGRVMDPDMAGKWICRMHPSVSKAAAGQCDICQMPLERTESLGYVPTAAAEKDTPLVVPASAVLKTGRRAVVYVKLPDRTPPVFQGRDIVLGPRAGDVYLVREGLTAGEHVVTRGSFKIDSALQIQAKPSMMSAPGEPTAAPDASSEVSAAELAAATGPYLKMQRALAGDDAAGAQQAAAKIVAALPADRPGPLRPLAQQAAESKGIEPLRKVFALLSEQLAAAARQHGSPTGGNLYRVSCPMAFDGRGARWLQDAQDVRNPYFGASMLSCGQVGATFPPAAKTPPRDHTHD